mmetsp:Transcript_23867/g.36536  ORF Transcript_23867/g.36536 Transcript_23867/m.36536 type:complete len:184 (+) Transcript_23867:1449-2000(+)
MLMKGRVEELSILLIEEIDAYKKAISREKFYRDNEDFHDIMIRFLNYNFEHLINPKSYFKSEESEDNNNNIAESVASSSFGDFNSLDNFLFDEDRKELYAPGTVIGDKLPPNFRKQDNTLCSLLHTDPDESDEENDAGVFIPKMRVSQRIKHKMKVMNILEDVDYVAAKDFTDFESGVAAKRK